MPKPRHPDGPKINAGISLREKTELSALKDFAKMAGFESVSAVVSFLVQEYLPIAREKFKEINLSDKRIASMNNLFSKEAVDQLNELGRKQEQLVQDCAQWFEEYAKPLFDRCQTMEDFAKVHRFMPSAVDDQNQIIDLPGNIGVYLAFAADAVRQKEAVSKGDRSEPS